MEIEVNRRSRLMVHRIVTGTAESHYVSTFKASTYHCLFLTGAMCISSPYKWPKQTYNLWLAKFERPHIARCGRSVFSRGLLSLFVGFIALVAALCDSGMQSRQGFGVAHKSKFNGF